MAARTWVLGMAARILFLAAALTVPQGMALAWAQDECPEPEAFGGAPSRRVALARDPALPAWDRVQAALDQWYQANFPPEPAAAQQTFAATAPVLQVEHSAAKAMAMRTEPALSARTCFISHRASNRIDYRIAFWFVIDSAGGATSLEVRWIGEHKGRGERTWQADQAWSPKAAAALVQLLTASRR